MIIRTILLLILLGVISLGISWMLTNNGSIIITWLGYEVRTDILTAIFCLLGLTLLTILTTNILTRLLSFKLCKIFEIFKPSEVKQLKKINQKQQDGLRIIVQTILAIELNDQKMADKLIAKLNKTIEDQDLKNLLMAKLAFASQDFEKCEKLLHKIQEEQIDEMIKINKFYQALKNKNEKLAIEIAQGIKSKKNTDFRLYQKLERLFEKNNVRDKLK